jgi:hypothetical protein
VFSCANFLQLCVVSLQTDWMELGLSVLLNASSTRPTATLTWTVKAEWNINRRVKLCARNNKLCIYAGHVLPFREPLFKFGWL